MVTIHRAYGARFIIYTDDYEPAHIHILDDGEAKIALDEEMKVIRSQGFSLPTLRKLLGIVRENRSDFMDRWKEIHG